MMIQPSGGGFWATVELLVDGIQDLSRTEPCNDDIEEWLETMANKVKKLKRKNDWVIDDNDDNDDDEEFDELDFGSCWSVDFNHKTSQLC